MNHDNILHFGIARQSLTVSERVKFKKIFETCEKLTIKHLHEIQEKMFEHADDTLFSLAEKADNTTDQTHYFDSMRIVRLKRESIEKAFKKNLHENFKYKEAGSQDTSPATEFSLENLSLDDLSLLDESDLEESIAIKNIVNKARNQFNQELGAINKRLAHIISTESLDEDVNPLAPKKICEAFIDALTELDIDLKISLIILKLFDKEIINGLRGLYDEVNNLFISENVLPKLKLVVNKKSVTHTPDANPHEEDELEESSEFFPDANISPTQNIAPNQNPAAQQQAYPNQSGGIMPGNLPQGHGSHAGTQNYTTGDTSIQHFQSLLHAGTSADVTAGDTMQQIPNMGNPASGVPTNSIPGSQTQVNTTGIPNGESTGQPGIAQVPSGQITQQGSGSINPAASPAVVGGSAPDSTKSSAQFVSALSAIQMNPVSIHAEADNQQASDIEGEPPSTGIRHINASDMTQHIIQQVQQQGMSESALSPIDHDVINIVSMLFEYILDDKNIADAAKALISKLQIPMLKVAIIDHEFFSTSHHPARSLLNELAKAALSINDDHSAATQNLLEEIERIVERVTNEFEDNIELFDELIIEFSEFMQQHEAEEHDVQEKIEETIKFKEDYALANQWVESTLETILSEKTLPEPVVSILNGPWKKVMLHTFLNSGQDSDTWKNQTRFIDILVWSVKPKNIKMDQAMLGNIIYQLLDTLRNGLTTIGASELQIQDIIEILEPYHISSLNIKPSSAETDVAETRTSETADTNTAGDHFLFGDTGIEVSEISDEDLSEQLTNETMPDKEEDNIPTLEHVLEGNFDNISDDDSDLTLDSINETIRKLESELSSLTDMEESLDTFQSDFVEKLDSEQDNEDKVLMENIVLSDYDTDNEVYEQVEDEYLDLARHLEQGKWVEFTNDEGKHVRAKLAWKSELLGEYTFTDWRFNVVADKTLNGLAADLRRGSAMIINDVPILDRALSAVMDGLTHKTQTA